MLVVGEIVKRNFCGFSFEIRKIYQCSGTPTDCVKLALDGLLTEKPDLVVSGINHGDNASVSIHYSGTVGAVLEACMKQVPAIAFSLKTKSQQCDFRPYEEVIMP